MATTRPAFLPNLGLAIILFAIVGSWFWHIPEDPQVLFGYGVLGLATLGLAFMALTRPPARNRDERWWVFAICLISMGYAFGYRFDPQNEQLRMVFWGRIVLQILASTALLSLGKSYALLPALREVRRSAFYRFVRHPVYGMYIMADMVVILLQPSLWNMGIALIGGTAFLLRALLEERVLSHDPVYARYMDTVPWRFFPGIF